MLFTGINDPGGEATTWHLLEDFCELAYIHELQPGVPPFSIYYQSYSIYQYKNTGMMVVIKMGSMDGKLQKVQSCKVKKIVWL